MDGGEDLGRFVGRISESVIRRIATAHSADYRITLIRPTLIACHSVLTMGSLVSINAIIASCGGRRMQLMNDQTPVPFHSIRTIDYTVILVRDMAAMRRFYEGVLRFPLTRELSAGWIEYQIGGNTLALSRPGRTAKDAPTPQAALRCSSRSRLRVDDVDRCADELVRHGVDLLEPPTNQPFGHRTLFFRDPDGNLLEVYAEI